MIKVSQKYKESVYAPIRKISGRVRFEILDTTSFKDNIKIVSSESVISKKEQLTNKIRRMSNKYAVLEKDYLKLDGSFILPSQADENDYEVGWWSENLCDENGLFTPYEVLEFDFTEEHSSMGLTIYFDILNDEYATDFDIDVYDLSSNLIVHEEVANNDKSTFVYVNQLSNYGKIVITIKRYCTGHRRVKITEVDFGIIKQYEDKDLVNMNVLQELDLTSNTLPSDELRFTIDNSNKEFNLLNPQGFYEFLQQGQECFPELGVEISPGQFEWVQVGKYYLKNWESEDNQLTAKFIARDILDTLTDETENKTERNISLYDLAIEVMEENNIEEYEITENLKNIRTKSLYKKTSYRNLLQLIAIAGSCVVYTDNTGRLHIKQLRSIKTVIRDIAVSSEAIISNKNEVLNNILEPSFNIASFEKNRFNLDGSFSLGTRNMADYEVGWWSNDISDENGLFSPYEVLEITTKQDHSSINLEILFDVINNEYASEFNLLVYDKDNNLVIDEDIINNSSRFSYDNNLLENSRKIEVIIKKWSQGNRRARVIEVGFDLPVDKFTFDNMYNEPKTTLNDGVKSVEVRYYPNALDESQAYILENENVKSGKTLKVDNTLINDENTAIKVAKWILRENSKVVDYSVDWRQNPALELADKVGIENRYTDSTIAYITKQELNFSGYLSGKTQAKGGI